MQLLILLAFVHVSRAMIGFGIDMYKPNCAFACRRAINRTPLTCSDNHMHAGNGHGASTTSPACFANDTSFLTTLAWCIDTRCGALDIDLWVLERYWQDRASNDPSVPAKWTYQEALEGVDVKPTRVVNITETLNYTGVISEVDYEGNRVGLHYFEHQEALHSRYAIVCAAVGVSLPVLFTIFTFLPGYGRISAIMRPYIILPSLLGRYHIQSLPFSLGNPPTLGQFGYILVFFLLNLFVTALDYSSHQPNAWFFDSKYEILLYICNRTGVIAFGLTPLVILFSGRNNFLLWITDWSHSTYMLLHRWVARIYTLQVVLHSILEVELYRYTGGYEEELVQPYWIWGIVGTVAACIMVIISSLWFRKKSYEIFLVLHIILAVFVIVGSWYHVELLFKRRWGYEFWIYAACAVWFFDRVLRGVWIANNGIRESHVTKITEGILRIDIPGVRWGPSPGQHAYAYFPGAKRLTFWEAHPFSVIPVFSSQESTSSASSQLEQRSDSDLEKVAATNSRPVYLTQPNTTGIRIYLRRHNGITRALTNGNIKTLLEGPYRGTSHNVSKTSSILTSDRLILLTGGIGISATLPYLQAHPHATLYWGLKARDSSLAMDVQASGLLNGKEVVLKMGERFDIQEVLREEMAGLTGRAKVGVVSCGPPSFCDDVRAAVVAAGRAVAGRVEVDLAEEAFSW